MAFQTMAAIANACSKVAQVATFAAVSPEVRKNNTPFHPAADDHRFRNPMWRSAPWDVMVQSQLALEQFWQEIRSPSKRDSAGSVRDRQDHPGCSTIQLSLEQSGSGREFASHARKVAPRWNMELA
jgi:hypothetical protein